jgi:two-component system response regulator HydG
MAETVRDALEERGYDATALDSSREALGRLAEGGFDALVTDLRMPEVDGLGLLAASRAHAPERPVLVMTAYGAIDSAVDAIRQGACHYLTKPFKMDELVLFLERALDEARVRREAKALKSTLFARDGLLGVVGTSPAMRRAVDVIGRVAPTDVPVLLLGETGTGKGLMAQTLHALSPRAAGPLVSVNCASLPEALLESELFGHVKGAFTGATSERMGLFVAAHGGTLFLDEIGEMSPTVQAKLLHVLETGRVRLLGSSTDRSVDVRVVSATHRNLRERIRTGEFREDLLYRLEVVAVEIPPLRQRREDLPALVAHFLEVARGKHPSSPVRGLSKEALHMLASYPWPGNVRELAHLLERLVLLGTREVVEPSELPAPNPPIGAELRFGREVMPARELLHHYATWALQELDGHKARTAERLGIDAKTLNKWLSLEPPEAA